MLYSQKLIIIGGCIISISVILGFAAFEQILKFGIRDQTALRKRNEIRSIYLKMPFPLDFRVYFFNISNPMEVQKGKTPVLKEVGPYCYDEFKEKIDVVDNVAEDSLTYTPYDIFIFNQEKSGLLKEDDYVTVLHPLIVGMVNQVTRDSPALLSIVNKAIGLIFSNLESIYVTAKVKDILFDGIEIDCRVNDFAGKAVCTQLKAQIPGLKMASEKDVFLFSLLGPRNATEGKSFKVKRGISNSKDLGRVLEVDGKKELTLWTTKECNSFKGTDGWIFPPLIAAGEEIWTYSPDLCRNMQAKFVRKTIFKGIDVFLYEADLGDMKNNDDEHCYCGTPKTCLKTGVFDLSKCMGVPIYATLPHFLRTDEIYFSQVEGMSPVPEKHLVRIHFEPMTGTPVEAKKRMQFNLPISPNNKTTLMKTIPEALHPIFWIEEGVELEGDVLKKVTNIFLLIKVIKIIRWLGVVTGILVMFYGLHLYFKNRNDLKITPTQYFGRNSQKTETRKKSSALNANNGINGDDNTGHTNPVMTGHEFDRY